MYRKRVIKGSFLTVLVLLLLLSFAVSAPAVSPGIVQTVLGPVKAEALGTTLMHEHFAFAYPGSFADATIAPYHYEATLKTNLGVIERAKKYGIATIVDATPNDVGGRDPRLYKALAKKTGINVICSTGMYTEHEGTPAYFKTRQDWYGTDIVPMLSELFIKEINDGIGTSGVKAGVIKCGTSGGGEISRYETSVLKAAAAAQKATGVPIITHTSGPAGGIEQADLFLKEGINPKKVMIGHVSNSKDIEYHRAILAKGVYIGFDRFGLEIFMPTPVLVNIVAQLCKEGFANQIMLSHDTVNVWVGRPYAPPEAVLKALANWRIDHISENVLPALKAQGVTDKQIKTMMVDNPRNLFLGK
jgi:phosphotriesterase-related protein